MEIKEKIFFEYLKCPMKAYFIGLNTNLEDNTSFKKLLVSTIKSYYFSSAYNNNTDIPRLKHLWDKVCEENQDIITPKKALEGRAMLFKTAEYIKNYGLNISDVNTSYTLDVPESKITVKGNLDPYIEYDNYIQIFITYFEKTLPNESDIEMKIKHNIDAYVLNSLYNKPVVISYYTPTLNKLVSITKGTRDFNKLEKIVKSIGSHIDLTPYPAETFMCQSCICKDLCRAWDGDL